VQTLALEKVLDEFPFFSQELCEKVTIRQFKYNFALKVTAAHTTDKRLDFITPAVYRFKKNCMIKKRLNFGSMS
jgi:hypothetical protein